MIMQQKSQNKLYKKQIPKKSGVCFLYIIPKIINQTQM